MTSRRGAVVRRLTHARGPNFSVGFRFLRGEKRRAVYAAYSVCRVADDIVDEVEPAGSTEEARQRLATWEDRVKETYAGRPEGPILRALAESLEQFPIPEAAFLGLIEGCRWDLQRSRYASWDELKRYCELVAVTISDISLAIFGTLDERAEMWGHSLALALQLTNICRDVAEDLERGRVYLPQDELARFGVEERQLGADAASSSFVELMRFQTERARSFYRAANPLPATVARDARSAVRMMGGIYVRILERIAADPERVLRGRVSIGRIGRAATVLDGLLGRPFVR